MSRSAQLPRLMSVLGAAFLLTACSTYRLGTGAETRFSSIYIAPITSDVTIPQAQALVGTQVREAFVRDGRVSLANSPEKADAVLRISLTGYDRNVTVSLPSDTGRARRFEVTLRAHATLTDNRTSQPLFAGRPLEARRGIFTDSGLVPSEYQGLPLLAEQIAHEAVHAVLDAW